MNVKEDSATIAIRQVDFMKKRIEARLGERMNRVAVLQMEVRGIENTIAELQAEARAYKDMLELLDNSKGTPGAYESYVIGTTMKQPAVVNENVGQGSL